MSALLIGRHGSSWYTVNSTRFQGPRDSGANILTGDFVHCGSIVWAHQIYMSESHVGWYCIRLHVLLNPDLVLPHRRTYHPVHVHSPHHENICGSTYIHPRTIYIRYIRSACQYISVRVLWMSSRIFWRTLPAVQSIILMMYNYVRIYKNLFPQRPLICRW